MSKKTAIEWLFEQLEEKGDLRETPSIRNIQLNIDTSEYLDLKRQAKEMEKEEIKLAYRDGLVSPFVSNYSWLHQRTTTKCEQYYKQIYGGNK